VAALQLDNLFREGVDGEAVLWAHQGLPGRGEARKLLLGVSDGSPMDSATSLANDMRYLDQHLRDAVQAVECAGLVQISAAGVALDLSRYHRRSHGIDLEASSANQVWCDLPVLIGGRVRG